MLLFPFLKLIVQLLYMLQITILDDDLPEDRESVFVVLSNVTFLPANQSVPGIYMSVTY